MEVLLFFVFVAVAIFAIYHFGGFGKNEEVDFDSEIGLDEEQEPESEVVSESNEQEVVSEVKSENEKSECIDGHASEQGSSEHEDTPSAVGNDGLASILRSFSTAILIISIVVGVFLLIYSILTFGTLHFTFFLYVVIGIFSSIVIFYVLRILSNIEDNTREILKRLK